LVEIISIFKTEWIIKILKLDQKFIEERIELELPAQTVLTVTIIEQYGF
jgi:hypothetical protein